MKFAKRSAVIALAILGLLFGAASAHADSFNWSVSGSGVLGGGTLTATNEGGGEYLVTGMTGDLYIGSTGGAVSLIGYTGAPGTYGIDATGLYDYDDLIFPSSTPELDTWGLLFNVAGFTDPLNLCGGSTSSATCSSSSSEYIQWETGTAGPGNDLGYASTYNAYGVSFSVTAPEPSSLLLLGVGLIGLMATMQLRKRLA